MELNKDLIFSIYPDPNYDLEKLTYSTQIVLNEYYYPDYLKYLSKKIDNAASEIELERAIDNFVNFVNQRKKEFIQQYQLSLARERINQRIVYIVINDNNEAVRVKDTGSLVYIAGPVGGGFKQLDHELNEILPEKLLFLITFDEKNVSHQIDHVEIEGDTNEVTLTIYDDFSYETSVDKLPFSFQNRQYLLVKASGYFEKKYQEISIINDFSPLIDSGITAAQSIIRANFIYFDRFPEVLNQKMEQNKLNNEFFLDFLGIQKIKISRNEKIRILGYSFKTDRSEYSMISDELFKGLKIFVLSEHSLYHASKLIESLKQDSDLLFEIQEYEKQFQKIGTRGQINQFEGRRSEILRQIIGPQALENRLNTFLNQKFTIPIGYISVDRSNPLNIKLETSFDNQELPVEYIAVLENFRNPLFLLATGPIRGFKYKVNEITLHFQIGKHLFSISTDHSPNTPKSLMVVNYNVATLEEFNSLFEIRERDIPFWYEEFCEIYQYYTVREIKQKISELIQPRCEEIPVTGKSTYPLTNYATRIFQPYIVPVLLKRILNEITEWEEGLNLMKSSSHIITEYEERVKKIEQDINQVNTSDQKFLQNQGLSERVEKMIHHAEIEVDMQQSLDKLALIINDYNPGLYSFIVNTLRREQPELMIESKSLFSALKSIFEDLKEAIIDFGLEAAQWVYADNLQIWNTYMAQIKYVKHSLVLQLREFLEDNYDGQDLDKLVLYPPIHNMIYNTLNGIVSGQEYIPLKKAYLYLLPKLQKHKDNLKKCTTVMEVLDTLKIVEEQKREKVRSQLPKLPDLYKR